MGAAVALVTSRQCLESQTKSVARRRRVTGRGSPEDEGVRGAYCSAGRCQEGACAVCAGLRRFASSYCSET